MVTWIPTIYPSHVSIFLPAPWILWVTHQLIWCNVTAPPEASTRSQSPPETRATRDSPPVPAPERQQWLPVAPVAAVPAPRIKARHGNEEF